MELPREEKAFVIASIKRKIEEDEERDKQTKRKSSAGRKKR